MFSDFAARHVARVSLVTAGLVSEVGGVPPFAASTKALLMARYTPSSACWLGGMPLATRNSRVLRLATPLCAASDFVSS